MKYITSLQQSIIKEKTEFFIYRFFIYAFFITFYYLFNLEIIKNQILQFLIVFVYTFFMLAQWYLFGKEVDHRLKIYYRVTSSIDRLIYRIFLGMISFILIFNAISFFPYNHWKYFFWILWPILGLFFSWPTRGKIIEESISVQLSELKFLDSFEKTVLFLIVFVFFVSMPFINKTNIVYINTFFTKTQQIGTFFKINYYPFLKLVNYLNFAKIIYFYILGMGFFWAILYAIFRFLMIRKLALLATFSGISSWGLYKYVGTSLCNVWEATFLLLWIWTFFWAKNSSAYRSGLFWGLISYFGALLQFENIYLLFLALINFTIFFKENDKWYKKQILKYFSLGIFLTFMNFIIYKANKLEIYQVAFNIDFLKKFYEFILGKAFFYLSIISIPLFFLKQRIDKLLLFIMFQVFLFSLFFLNNTATFLIFPICYFSIIPIKLIFYSVRNMRSKQNFIFVVYIFIILLDSHLEGRIKILLNYFK